MSDNSTRKCFMRPIRFYWKFSRNMIKWTLPEWRNSRFFDTKINVEWITSFLAKKINKCQQSSRLKSQPSLSDEKSLMLIGMGCRESKTSKIRKFHLCWLVGEDVNDRSDDDEFFFFFALDVHIWRNVKVASFILLFENVSNWFLPCKYMCAVDAQFFSSSFLFGLL